MTGLSHALMVRYMYNIVNVGKKYSMGMFTFFESRYTHTYI